MIVHKHTRVVQYFGANSQLYSKTCVPSKRQVSLNDSLLIRTGTARAVARFAGRDFSFLFAVAPDTKGQPVLLETDLPEKLPLCQQCGLIDGRDSACPICGKFICQRCLPANTGRCCSDVCYAKQQYMSQQELLLAEITDATFRERVRRSQEQVLRVYSISSGQCVFTNRAVYIAELDNAWGSITDIARADIGSIDIKAKGIWPMRRWEVILLIRQGQRQISFEDRVDAEAFIDVLNGWANGQSISI